MGVNNSDERAIDNLKADLSNSSALFDLAQNNTINADQIDLLISGLILFLSTVMAIMFNGALLFSIWKHRKKQWVVNAQQIVYLILSDFLVGVLLLPRNGLIFISPTGLTYRICATFSYMLTTTQSVSFYHMMAVCIHRYKVASQIQMPMGVDNYSYGKESLAIWVGVLLIYLPPYIFWGRHGESVSDCRMGSLFGPSDTGAKIYLFVLYVIPWLTTNFLYVFVLLKVKKSVQRVHADDQDTNAPTNTDSFPSQAVQANKKILLTVGFLLLAFNASLIVCIASILGMLFGIVIPPIFQSFILVNNICNPFIYISASSSLKKETYGIFLNLRCKCLFR